MPDVRRAALAAFYALSLLWGDAGSEEGEWRTINGAHVLIDPDSGKVIKGPEGMVGTVPGQGAAGKPEAEPQEPSPPPTAQAASRNEALRLLAAALGQRASRGQQTKRLPNGTSDHTVSFDGKEATLRITDADAADMLRSLFKAKATPENLIRLLAPPDGAEVTTVFSGGQVIFDVSHPHFSSLLYAAMKDRDGKPLLYYDFAKKAQGAPAGLMLPTVRDTVRAASQMGMRRLHLQAAGSSGGNGDWNGGYTWATYGFGADLSLESVFDAHSERRRADEADRLFGVRTLGGLMLAEGGREWWSRNFVSFGGSFIVGDDRFRQVLNRRLTEKGLEPL